MPSYLIIIALVILAIILKLIKSRNINSEVKLSNTTMYYYKKIMTESEYAFYLKLKALENNYIVHPQLNLATIVNKHSNIRFANELFRNIDFAIYDKNYDNLLLLIELNDISHNSYKRKLRDKNVKKICDEINIPLMFFYTKYPNEQSYVINRILTELNKKS